MILGTFSLVLDPVRCNDLGLNHVEKPWMQRNGPIFFSEVGCPVYLAKDPACLKQERSSPRRLDTGMSF